MKTITRFCLALSLAAVLSSSPLLTAPAFAQDKETAENAEMRKQLDLFAEVFTMVRDNYVEDVTDEDLIDGALNGALSSLDPHSSYLPAEDHQERQKNARREYGGLGIEVTLESGLVKVNYVIPDGPAAKQGIKRGDFITAVEGERVLGKTLNDAVDGMRGLAGDPINVTVLSPDNTTREVTVIREKILGRAVRHRVEEGVGYIYIESFNHPRLTADVKNALEELKSELGGRLPGLIIDVRSNPGGRVDQVVNVTGYFLDGGEVFSSSGRNKSFTKRYHADQGEVVPDVPIVVLINSQSASAAEIIAGALQDRNRALVVGRRSFGKGSVQSIMNVKSEGALRLTTERYYTPSGRSIQGLGIMPDILVSARPESETTRKRFRESDLKNSLGKEMEIEEEDFDSMVFPSESWPDDEDFQLSKAIELVKSPSLKSKLSAKNTLIKHR